MHPKRERYTDSRADEDSLQARNCRTGLRRKPWRASAGFEGRCRKGVDGETGGGGETERGEGNLGRRVGEATGEGEAGPFSTAHVTRWTYSRILCSIHCGPQMRRKLEEEKQALTSFVTQFDALGLSSSIWFTLAFATLFHHKCTSTSKAIVFSRACYRSWT